VRSERRHARASKIDERELASAKVARWKIQRNYRSGGMISGWAAPRVLQSSSRGKIEIACIIERGASEFASRKDSGAVNSPNLATIERAKMNRGRN
jgi:hypothetical protein